MPAERTVDERMAALEEFIVAAPRTTVEELLDRAERARTAGQDYEAQRWLTHAKIARELDEIEEKLGLMEEDEDDG